MKKILVASHGHLASGIQCSVQILTGMADQITAIDCYVDDSDYTPKLQEFIDSVGPEDEGVIFTDIYGGSVFQKVMMLEPEKHGIVHVTGMNLGLVIETLISCEPVSAESLGRSIDMARQTMQIVQPPEADSCSQESDDDFFD